MSSSDDERLQRLTELARRVCEMEPTIEVVGPQAAIVWDGPFVLIDIGGHPHALDALEAALLVLTGDVTIRGVRGAVLVPMLPIDRDAECIVDGLVAQSQAGQRMRLVPAWVEQLASEWDMNASMSDCSLAGTAVSDCLLRCAAELRRRAKGGEP